MANVFISYGHVEPDNSIAFEIREFLAACGVSVFLDTEIRIGDQWGAVIDEQLDDSRYLIVLLSEASVASAHVREEIRRAHARKITILPIQINTDVHFPYAIGAYMNDRQIRQLGHTSLHAICQEILAVVLGQSVGNAADGAEDNPPPETGTVGLGSPYYVRRQVDTEIETLLRQSGMTILLRGPRQVGKSSLLVRAEAAAKRHGQSVARIDFQMVDDEHRQDLKTLLLHLAHVMAVDFDTTVLPGHVWNEQLGSKKSLTRFMELGVLKPASSGVVLCLDEVDSAFAARYCDDFFGMLRFWHNERAISPLWRRLHLVITHSTDPALWIRDLDMSPFNVGERYRLADFTATEVRDLAARYQLRADIEGLIHLVGGHPYLTRRALHALKTSSLTLEDFKTTAASLEGPFRDHLRHLLHTISQQDELRTAFRQILDHSRCDSERAFQRLYGAGLVKGDSRDSASPRCELYRSVLH